MASLTMQREQAGDVSGLAWPLSVRAGQPSTLKLSAVLRHMTVPSCVVADSKDLAGSRSRQERRGDATTRRPTAGMSMGHGSRAVMT